MEPSKLFAKRKSPRYYRRRIHLPRLVESKHNVMSATSLRFPRNR